MNRERGHLPSHRAEPNFPILASSDPESSARTLSQRLALWLALIWIALVPIQIPLLREGGRSLNLALSDIALAIAVVAAFPALRFMREVWSVWHFALPAAITLSLLTVGVYTRYTMLNKVVGMLVLLAAYLLLTSVAKDRADLFRMIKVYVVSVTVLNFVALAAHLSGFSVPLVGCEEPCQRFRGFMPDANLYGSILVVAFCLIRSFQGAGAALVSRLVDWLMQATLLVGILFTVSRSTWLALAATIILSVWIVKSRDIRVWLSLLVVGGFFAIALAGDQIVDITDLAGRTQTIDSRWMLIDQGLAAIASNPVFGIGLGVFAEQHGQIIHNTPLWLAAELGLVGLVVFFGFIGWFMQRLYYLYRRSTLGLRPLVDGVILGNVAMFVFSMSVEALYQRHWWLLFAMTGAIYRQAVDKSPSGSSY